MGINLAQIEVKGLNLLSSSPQIAALVAEHEKRIAPLKKWAQEIHKQMQPLLSAISKKFDPLARVINKVKTFLKKFLKPSYPIQNLPNLKNSQPFKPKSIDKLNLELLFTNSLKLHAPPAICRNSNRQAAGLTF